MLPLIFVGGLDETYSYHIFIHKLCKSKGVIIGKTVVYGVSYSNITKGLQML